MATYRYRSDLQFMKDAAGNFFNLFMLRALSQKQSIMYIKGYK